MSPRKKVNLGLLVLGVAWLVGTGALNLGLLRDGGDVLATLGFLAAAVLWLVAYRLLRTAGRSGLVVSLLLLLLWAFGLGVAVAIGRAQVYRTMFFVVSAPVTTALLVLTCSPLVSKKRIGD
jgi:hypothetical protein